MTWNEWKEGVQAAYELRENFEARLERGEALTEEETAWLAGCRRIAERYAPTGRKRRKRHGK